MKYSPLKIWLIMAATLALLLLITLFSTSNTNENGTITEGFNLGSVAIKYPTTSSFLNQGASDGYKEKSIDSLVADVEEMIATVDEDESKEQQPAPDFTKIDSSKVQRIAYPSNKVEFLDQLRSYLNSGSCRIIHYGDSQIEGDRISAYLRNRFQGIYGGSGPGFVPVLQVYEQISANVIPSDNWMRYAYFDPTQKKLPHKAYGAYTSLSRFTEPAEFMDSLALDTLKMVTAKISVGIPSKSYGNLKKFSRIGLHYGNSTLPTSVKVLNGGNLIKDEQLISDGKYHNLIINLNNTPSQLEIILEGKISPDFYGITLDGDRGITLDNVAMRGSSGTVFAGSNAEVFAQMLQSLNPKLLLFQYGGNSVPYLKDSLEVQNYAKYLKNHISWVQRKSKDAKVLFIGPSDMSTSQNGERITYPLLPYLDSTLQTICQENGMAYWSMYKAMGGKNSMPYWVEQKLAGDDYTHFSPSGTKIISELLFLSLYLDLNDAP